MTLRIKIRPTTNRLRQLIRDHGDVWEMTGHSGSIIAFQGDRGVEVRSLNGRHIRWVRLKDTRPIIQKG